MEKSKVKFKMKLLFIVQVEEDDEEDASETPAMFKLNGVLFDKDQDDDSDESKCFLKHRCKHITTIQEIETVL